MPVFQLLGADTDETRLLLDEATGYSVSLPGHPTLTNVPDGLPRYDAVISLRDVAVEHGVRIDVVPSAVDPMELARALVTAYAKNRSALEVNPNVKPITQRLRPGTTGGAQAIYSLRDTQQPTMEQVWVLIRPCASGYWALYHTTRFRNDDVHIFRWAHIRASIIDQHHWDPDSARSVAGDIWPSSLIALPSVKLDLTELGWSEAGAKAHDMGPLSNEEALGLLAILRDVAQTDEPPRTPVLPPTIQILANRISMHGTTRAAAAMLRNLEQCKSVLDLRAWAWQCAWAIGNRESLQAPT